jgi:hypothetical protein
MEGLLAGGAADVLHNPLDRSYPTSRIAERAVTLADLLLAELAKGSSSCTDFDWLESQEFTIEREQNGSVLVTVTLYSGGGEPSFVERRGGKLAEAIKAVRRAVAS